MSIICHIFVGKLKACLQIHILHDILCCAFQFAVLIYCYRYVTVLYVYYCTYLHPFGLADIFIPLVFAKFLFWINNFYLVNIFEPYVIMNFLLLSSTSWCVKTNLNGVTHAETLYWIKVSCTTEIWFNFNLHLSSSKSSRTSAIVWSVLSSL